MKNTFHAANRYADAIQSQGPLALNLPAETNVALVRMSLTDDLQAYAVFISDVKALKEAAMDAFAIIEEGDWSDPGLLKALDRIEKSMTKRITDIGNPGAAK